MRVVCPTVLASSQEEYDRQIKLVSFAPRIQLDFMDGEFVETKSIEIADAWWPENIQVDMHLMYAHPDKYLDILKQKKPRLVIIHAEADIDLKKYAAELHKTDILAGLCVLPDTQINDIADVLPDFDHLLIFGGHLGHFGGTADMTQAKKAAEAKHIKPDIEIGWDGGMTDKVAKELVDNGVDVLNAGSFVHKAENPQAAYEKLLQLIGQ